MYDIFNREKKKTITSYGNFGFHERSPFSLSNGSLGRLSTCEPRSLQNPTSFMEGSLLYGGAVTNPKHLRRGLRCNQARSVIPVEPPMTHMRPQCGGVRNDNDHSLQNDCCSCSSATGSTGTASLTGSFVMKWVYFFSPKFWLEIICCVFMYLKTSFEINNTQFNSKNNIII